MFGRRSYRRPKENYKYDSETGLVTNELLQNTNESVHACVRLRQYVGPGAPRRGTKTRQGTYTAMADQGWQLDSQPGPPPIVLQHATTATINGRQAMNSWSKRASRNFPPLPEDLLGDTEVAYFKLAHSNLHNGFP